jgi:CBS domain-containing protein
MANVRNLLQRKEKSFWTISPESSAYEAIQIMASHDVGALVVMEGSQMVGIITERDYIRKVLLGKRHLEDIRIREIMTEKVISVSPEQTIDGCMALMIDHQIRHLPVTENGKPMGIISIRDVVSQVVSDQEFMISQLENYIMACPVDFKR